MGDNRVTKHSPLPRRWPRAIDLFCGSGGLTTGLRRARFRVVGAVDVEPLAVETYRANHPDVRVWEKDLRQLSVAEVRRALDLMPGELELLAGCPPCEGFSTLRTLNGNRRVKDARNDLIYHFMRFVRGLRPQTIMIENVPGLEKNYRMDEVCDELYDLGYDYTVDILDVSRYGVPQRRRRMLLLAGRKGHIDLAPEDERRVTVRQAIGKLPAPSRSSDPLHSLGESRSEAIMELIRQIPKDGGSRTDLGSDRQLACHRRCDGFKDVYGRMAWDSVAPTITSGCVNPSKGRFLHPEQDRAITLREAATLQTFPADYSFSLSKGKFAAAALIGDALPPEFVRRHAEQVRSYLMPKG